MLGRVQGCHLDGGDGLESLGDGVAHHAVHVAFVDERAGVAVVGAEDEIAAVETPFGNRFDLGSHVVPGGAEAQHGLHALAHAGDGVFDASAFVVVGGAASHVAVEGTAQVGRGVMAADDFARFHGFGHFGVHLGVAHEDAGEVHHFAQADDAGPGHGFGHFGRADGRAGGFQTGGAGHAAWHLHVDVDGQGLALRRASV